MPPTNDTYIAHQWALWPQGQKSLRDIDDIHPESVLATEKAGVGWEPNLEATLQRDAVVAVIDSGMDVAHPDLEGSVYTNDVECVNGKPPIGAQVEDKDGNGYAGDCMGWNFATPNPAFARRVNDDYGHGTHIAGIIAARSNNGIGISGVSNRLKVLPLKVYNDKEDIGPARSTVPDRVAEAIDYAVARGVDVINISMGWPVIIHTEKIQKSIDAALAKNVVVVAAAGNDRHEAQIFPCAQKGVICVGALDLDTSLARFSNHGGHVDVYAPGYHILSTWPTQLSSDVFGPRGYELKLGTSHAAPYIAAAAAMLKASGVVTASEVRRKIVAAGGNMKVVLASNAAAQALPNFKGLNTAVVNPKTQELRFEFEVENFSKTSANVSVRALDTGVTLDGQLILKPGQTAMVGVSGRVKSLGVNAHQKIEVSINGRLYEHQILLVQDSLLKAESYALSEALTSLSSFQVYAGVSARPEYYRVEATTEGLRVHVYELNQKSVDKKGEFVVPEATEVFMDPSLVRVDLNGDGKLDYFVSALKRGSNNQVVSYYYGYFDESLKPLYGVNSVWKLKLESVVPSFRNMQFVSLTSSALGTVKAPVFWSTGLIPSKDKNPNVFEFEKQSRRERLYYFEPVIENGVALAQTRLFNNSDFEKSFRKQNKLSVKDDFTVHFPQWNSALNDNAIKLVVSYGNGVKRQYRRVVIQDLLTREYTTEAFDNAGLDMQGEGPDEAMISNADQLLRGTSLIGIYSQTKARTAYMSDDEIEPVLLTELTDPRERLLSHVKSFKNDDGYYSFFETDTTLAVTSRLSSGATRQAEAPIFRFSFLPGRLFSQRLIPLLVGSEQRPGVYINNQIVYSPTVYVWTVNQNGELTIPLRHSYVIPESCQALNPTREGVAKLVLACRNQDSTLRELKLLEL